MPRCRVAARVSYSVSGIVREGWIAAGQVAWGVEGVFGCVETLAAVDVRLSGLAVVRFADNYCLLAPTPAAAQDAFAQATAALATEGLQPNARKSCIRGHANPEDLFLLRECSASVVAAAASCRRLAATSAGSPTALAAPASRADSRTINPNMASGYVAPAAVVQTRMPTCWGVPETVQASFQLPARRCTVRCLVVGHLVTAPSVGDRLGGRRQGQRPAAGYPRLGDGYGHRA